MRKQRSSLVETNVNGVKTVFGCSGTIFETQARVASGYCFAFDVASNTVSAMLAMTAGEGAGVWMAGQGAAADAQGFLYVLTGNGDFDGATQWGESFLKLQYTPSSGGAPASLQVVDHWTPWTDLARSGQAAAPAEKLAGMSAPSEAIKPVGGGMNITLKNAKRRGDDQRPRHPNPPRLSSRWPPALGRMKIGDRLVRPAFSRLAFALRPERTESPIRSKRQSLGGTTLADLANPKANCAKLAAPPVWLTMSPGTG